MASPEHPQIAVGGIGHSQMHVAEALLKIHRANVLVSTSETPDKDKIRIFFVFRTPIIILQLYENEMCLSTQET